MAEINIDDIEAFDEFDFDDESPDEDGEEKIRT
jgi:hypothetical protein